MAYNIYKADGTLITIPDNAISNEFYNESVNGAGKGVGLQLVGRNVVGYGAAIAQDLLQIASSFASASVPADSTSLQGQLWFNSADLALYVRLNNNLSGGIANWKQVGAGGTLQTVTDNGNSTSNQILFTGTGGPSGAPVTISRQHNGAFSNWLELNGMVGVLNNGTGAQGIAPIPAFNDIAVCGAVGLRWSGVFTNGVDMTGALTWNELVYPTPPNTGTKYLCDNGTWATPAGGGGGGTLQQVTDAGNTTTNSISFTEAGGGGGPVAIGKYAGQPWLELNSTVGVSPGGTGGGGIAPIPAYAGLLLCGGPIDKWMTVYTIDHNMTGTLTWNGLVYPVPPNTNTKFLCDNGTWAIPAGGGGGVGSLQTVTDNGSSTSHPISFTGTGGPSGAPVTISRQANGAISNWLELNGTIGVIASSGIAPIPAFNNTALCGAIGLRWGGVFTTGIDMAGTLTWGTSTYSLPPGTGTKFLCDNGTWAIPSGGGGGVGSLQTVTDNGSSTSNSISFTGTGGPSGAPVTISRQANGAFSNWLELNGMVGVMNLGVGAQGIAPAPAFNGIAYCGAAGLRWSDVFTTRTNMSSTLTWGSLTYSLPPNTGTKYLCDNGTWATPAGGGGSGTVTSVTAGTGLSGGTITTTGTIALANTAVTAGSYTSANITVDAQGRITSASNGSAPTLQAVTNAGNTTSNQITSASGTGSVTLTGALGNVTLTGTTGAVYIAHSTAFGANSLDVNGGFNVIAGLGMTPPVDNVMLCGNNGLAWTKVYSYAYPGPSDQRLKNNIQDSALGLSFINSLRPVSYNWINPGEHTATQYGLIAQEVESVISTNDFAGLTYDAESDRYSLAYMQFIAPMVKAIQELTSKNTQLEAALADLLARVTALEAI